MSKFDMNHRHFKVELVDKECKPLEAILVKDEFNQDQIRLKDKAAVLNLIVQLARCMEELSE